MNCPLCTQSADRAFEIRGYQLLDCGSCGHRYAEVAAGEQHVSAHYGDDYFNGGGAGYTDYAAEAGLLRARGRMYAKKLNRFTTPGRILDVGAASGYILKGFEDEGWSGIGIEPNATMAENGRDNQHVDIRVASFESFVTDESFDVVSMIQVAAHFYEPRTAFVKAHESLKDGGHLLIETWDRGSVSARLLGKNWHEYSPPTVLHWYSKTALISYLQTIGFEYVTGGRPSKKISGGHVRSLLKYRLGDNFLLKLIPEKVNFSYPSEDLFWAVFRKK